MEAKTETKPDGTRGARWRACCECLPGHAGPRRPGSLFEPPQYPLPLLKHHLQVYTRDDGALNVHLHEPVPATCCDGRMAYIFVCRGGGSRCILCDAKRGAA